MKVLSKLITIICILFTTVLYAKEDCVKLNIKFDSLPHKYFYKHALHFDNQIQLNPYYLKSRIVHSTSELQGRFPHTIALLVKPTHFDDDTISLQFNLLYYGFTRAGSILMQPLIIVKKGQYAQIQTEKYKLSVTADWS